jgi:hypothetical protein
MTEPSAPSVLERRKHRSASQRTHRRPQTGWSTESIHPVEIVVHDWDSARILLEYAAPPFQAHVVSGSAWTVRLQPPTGEGWTLQLLSLIERWLESARLPCAKVLHGGRSYLVRASPDIAGFSTVTDITSARGGS